MFNKIFGNVGGTLKLLAKIVLVVFCVAGIIAWMALMGSLDSYLQWIPWVVLVGSFLVGWIISLLIYSWGIVVESHEF